MASVARTSKHVGLQRRLSWDLSVCEPNAIRPSTDQQYMVTMWLTFYPSLSGNVTTTVTLMPFIILSCCFFRHTAQEYHIFITFLYECSDTFHCFHRQNLLNWKVPNVQRPYLIKHTCKPFRKGFL